MAKKRVAKKTPPREEEIERKPPSNPFAALPISGEPPPPLKEGDAILELAQVHPEYVVTMDAGVYWFLRRYAESAALTAHTNPVRRAITVHYECALRAAETLRRSHDAVHARHVANVERTKRIIGKR